MTLGDSAWSPLPFPLGETNGRGTVTAGRRWLGDGIGRADGLVVVCSDTTVRRRCGVPRRRWPMGMMGRQVGGALVMA
jgi:hypothetical protein